MKIRREAKRRKHAPNSGARFFGHVFAIKLGAKKNQKNDKNQKNPQSVRTIFVRNSGAGNGCANFMDAWKNASVLQEKPCP